MTTMQTPAPLPRMGIHTRNRPLDVLIWWASPDHGLDMHQPYLIGDQQMTSDTRVAALADILHAIGDGIHQLTLEDLPTRPPAPWFRFVDGAARVAFTAPTGETRPCSCSGDDTCTPDPTPDPTPTVADPAPASYVLAPGGDGPPRPSVNTIAFMAGDDVEFYQRAGDDTPEAWFAPGRPVKYTAWFTGQEWLEVLTREEASARIGQLMDALEESEAAQARLVDSVARVLEHRHQKVSPTG